MGFVQFIEIQTPSHKTRNSDCLRLSGFLTKHHSDSATNKPISVKRKQIQYNNICNIQKAIVVFLCKGLELYITHWNKAGSTMGINPVSAEKKRF